jgi:hypothetical protein
MTNIVALPVEKSVNRLWDEHAALVQQLVEDPALEDDPAFCAKLAEAEWQFRETFTRWARIAA